MKHPNFRDFETETKKSACAPEPPAPPSLAPLSIVLLCKEISFMACIQFKCNPKADLVCLTYRYTRSLWMSLS